MRRDEPRVRAQWRVSQIYWASIGFLGVWLGLRMLGVGGPLAPGALWFPAVLLLEAVNLALRSADALQRDNDERSWRFTLADLVLIAAGLRLTGGVDSPLWIVLFVVVLAETVLSPSREAGVICGAAGAALLAGTWSPRVVPADYLLDIATRAFFLVAVSITTRRLRENAAAKDAEIAGLRAELAAAGERARISREIHDGVGNALAAAVLRLEVAARVCRKQPEAALLAQDVPATLQEEAGALREAMQAVRDWTFFARPWATSENLRFSEVLRREAERFERRTGLPVTVTGADVLDDLPEPTRVAILRIAQEALTNAAKHAGAERAVITLCRDENNKTADLTVSDDGQGFDPAGAGAGIGLASMRERAEALGGSFALDAAPGRGVTLSVRLPAS